LFSGRAFVVRSRVCGVPLLRRIFVRFHLDASVDTASPRHLQAFVT
jgi:hypothetical protein